MRQWLCLSCVCIAILSVTYALRLHGKPKPTENKKRGEKSASLMVDAANEVKYEEDNLIPTMEEMKEKAKVLAVEEADKEAALLKKESKAKMLEQEHAYPCDDPPYERDYSKDCPEGFTIPSWAEGSCYQENAPPGAGSALIDFSSMTPGDKLDWEKRNCKFFPPLGVIKKAEALGVIAGPVPAPLPTAAVNVPSGVIKPSGVAPIMKGTPPFGPVDPKSGKIHQQ